MELLSRAKTKYKRDGLFQLASSGVRRARNTLSKLIQSPFFVDDLDTWGARNGDVWQYGSYGQFEIHPPLLRTIPDKFESRNVVGEQTYEPGFVAAVPNATILGSEGLCCTPNYRFIVEPHQEQKYIKRRLSRFLDDTSIEEVFNRSTDDIDRAVYLMSRIRTNGRPNYAHWVCEILPQLRAVEHYRAETCESLPLLIDHDPPRWMVETLELMGYPPEECIEFSNAVTNVSELIIPKKYYHHSHTVCYNPIGKQWVRNRMRSNLRHETVDRDFSRRVFLPRQNTSRRKIRNFDEVSALLTELGFESYYPENMSIAEEVKLLSEADTIVGTFGANMGGIIYATDAPVVGIQAHGSFSLFYMTLANELGLSYDFVNGISTDQSDWSMHDDITVDVDELRYVVTNAIEHS